MIHAQNRFELYAFIMNLDGNDQTKLISFGFILRGKYVEGADSILMNDIIRLFHF